MDLPDFGAEAMSFDEPLDAQAQRLIDEAAEKIGEDAGEQALEAGASVTVLRR
jgi:hypothetical protein